MALIQWPTLRIAMLITFLPPLTPVASAQTLLQRCLGLTPGRELHGPVTPSPATMSYCRQLPAWNLYDEAGRLFQSGDHAGAARVALQAAAAGNPEAQLRVALLYPKGDGVPKDAAAAFRWMRAAAAQGEPMAQDLLGTIYEYGRSTGFYAIGDDWDEAAKLWQASAAQGYAKGEFSLGRAYQYGIGVPLDQQMAISWYDKASAQGDSQAAYFAKYLRDNHGMDGSTRDDQERAMLGSLMGRTVPFIAPFGTTFHHLSERLAFVHQEYANQETAKAKAAYDSRSRAYKQCRDAGRDNCVSPGAPPK
ncbi:MAG TPA: tetratricopeptide repeat protein [Bryobacteraceae bacterium]|nr:tetratricopeptide repeat protein [Bryobacteraceae bacterium]